MTGVPRRLLPTQPEHVKIAITRGIPSVAQGGVPAARPPRSNNGQVRPSSSGLFSDMDPVLIGDNATATDVGEVSIGPSATVTDVEGVAVGDSATAGRHAVAVGLVASATGSQAIAIGDHASANYDNSAAIGEAATANAVNEFVLGNISNIVIVNGLLVIADNVGGLHQIVVSTGGALSTIAYP